MNKNSQFSIEQKKTFIIAEVGQNHDGSLGIAHSYIDAVADAGADAIKFQTHISNAESTLDEPFRKKFSKQDKTRFDYWKRMQFEFDQWQELHKHAEKKGLVFLSSAFSVEAVKLLSKIGMPIWKIGSGEFNNQVLLNAIIEIGSPILLSTGMSTLKEIDDMIKILNKKRVEYGILQCTSMYPTTYEKVGLNIIKMLKKKYNCPVGLSDHSGSIFPSLAALSRDCSFIEVHVTFDKRMFGPDISSSITIEDLNFLIKARDAFFIMDSNPVDKDILSNELSKTRKIFDKSLALKTSLKKNTILKKSHLTIKKPGFGIPYTCINKVIGRKLNKSISSDRILKWEHLID